LVRVQTRNKIHAVSTNPPVDAVGWAEVANLAHPLIYTRRGYWRVL